MSNCGGYDYERAIANSNCRFMLAKLNTDPEGASFMGCILYKDPTWGESTQLYNRPGFDHFCKSSSRNFVCFGFILSVIL